MRTGSTKTSVHIEHFRYYEMMFGETNFLVMGAGGFTSFYC